MSSRGSWWAGRHPGPCAPTWPWTPWRWLSGAAAASSCRDLVHHSDRGVQYLAVRYTERLAEARAVASVGSRGDSYDNALAESFSGLYKTELIRQDGPWRGLEAVEFATLEYLDWFNQRRLHTELGMTPPAEFEAAHY